MSLDQDENQRALDAAMCAAQNFAEAVAGLRPLSEWMGQPPLGSMTNYLMTELWDRGFSQTEIRAAFTNAVNDIDRYAAGQERR